MLSTACAAPGGCDPELCDTVPLVESDPEGGQSPALIIATPRPADGTRRAPREKRAQAAGSCPDRVSADNQRLSHALSTATSVVETQKFFPPTPRTLEVRRVRPQRAAAGVARQAPPPLCTAQDRAARDERPGGRSKSSPGPPRRPHLEGWGRGVVTIDNRAAPHGCDPARPTGKPCRRLAETRSACHRKGGRANITSQPCHRSAGTRGSVELQPCRRASSGPGECDERENPCRSESDPEGPEQHRATAKRWPGRS